jgi:hypothetical protein
MGLRLCGQARRIGIEEKRHDRLAILQNTPFFGHNFPRIFVQRLSWQMIVFEFLVLREDRQKWRPKKRFVIAPW